MDSVSLATVLQSSMASLHLVFLLLLLAPSLPTFAAESGRKELRTKNEVYQENIRHSGNSVQSNRVDPSRVIPLSWRPRVFLYKGFLTDEECDQLISLARGKKERLSAIGAKSGNLVMKRFLASSQVSSNLEDDLAAKIEKRISAWTLLPLENGTPLEFEHYVNEDAAQKYDYFDNRSSISIASEPLMAVVLLYLSNVIQGGHFLFPHSRNLSVFQRKMWSDCSAPSPAMKPVKGNAVLFFTSNLDASLDGSSSHSRCPVLAGELWSAFKFIFIRPVKGPPVQIESGDGECTDEDESCTQWAALGECQKNPLYMIGSPDYYGTCRKSCNAC